MPFLDLGKDYADMVRFFSRTRLPEDSAFLQWLEQNRTILTLHTAEENTLPVTDKNELRHLRTRRERLEKGQALERGDLKYFCPSSTTRQELSNIRAYFRFVTEEDKRTRKDNVQSLLRRTKHDLTLLYAQWHLRELQKHSSADIQPYAELPDGYRLVILKTEREAIREGQHTRNCLRELELPINLRSYDMTSFVDALASGNLMSLRDGSGKSVATLRFKDGMLVEVRGFANKGLLHHHAMLLREFFLAKKTPTDVRAAEFLGLIFVAGKGFVPYETILPRIFAEDIIEMDGWPVTDHDMALLKGRRNLTRLSLIGCVNVNAMPKDIGFKSGERFGVYLRPRNKQPNPMTVGEANEFLAYQHSIRPNGNLQPTPIAGNEPV